MADYDARLVELYDTDNPDGSDHEFYRQLADEIGAGAILDIGCGTVTALTEIPQFCSLKFPTPGRFRS